MRSQGGSSGIQTNRKNLGFSTFKLYCQYILYVSLLLPVLSVCETGVMKRASSMSYMDGCVGTWPKEKRLVSKVGSKLTRTEDIHWPAYVRRCVVSLLN